MSRQILTLDQAEKTLQYLEAFAKPPYPPRVVSLAVFARACIFLNPDFEFRESPLEEEAEGLAKQILSRDGQDLDLDPFILASHANFLHSGRIEIGDLKEVLSKIAASVHEQPVHVRQMGRVRHTVAILRALDFETGLEAAPRGALKLLDDPTMLLSAPSDDVMAALDHAAADRKPLSNEVSDILGLLALAELRDYRIDFASKILRLLLNAGHRCEALSEAMSFIALQRVSDGSYGFYDPFKEENPSEQDRQLKFHLPITLNAVWLDALRSIIDGETAMVDAA
ncbi:MAG: hypothetical protein AAFY47_06555 [Pseudomonadota bacterium]